MKETAAEKLTQRLAELLLQRGQRICTAESCTGGLIAKTFTDLAGSSEWFDRGFVTYSNQAKIDMLGVSADTLELYGAVSQQVAAEMAAGAVQHSQAQVSIAVSGIAGPGGGSELKPVGTVWFGFASDGRVSTETRLFDGNRDAVRQSSLHFAIETMLKILQK
jgi:nicotinamide-nucleotide amidase